MSIQLPAEWERLDVPGLAGTIVVIGETDTGKSTFVRWLVHQLCRHHERVGWLDADVGQSTLGVPTTMNLAVLSQPTDEPPFPEVSFFVGNTSPRGHMLPTVVGTHKLQVQAQRMEAGALVVDTTGLVTQDAGGGALKHWKIALLEPTTVVAIQRHGELVHILTPLVRDSGVITHTLPVAGAVNRKTREERVERRQRQFRRYFDGAKLLRLEYNRLPVYGLEQAKPRQLLALQDKDGFFIALAVVEAVGTREIAIVTPASGVANVASLRVGSLRVDPKTGKEVRSSH